MDSLEKLKLAIIEQVRANVPVQVVWAECVVANPAQGTMTATREGLEYDDVLLGLGDTITVPAPGSKVLLGLVENQRTATWLIYAEAVREIRLHGKAHGGLVLANTVHQTDALLINKVNQLLAALNAWTPTVPPTPADLATLKAALLTATTTPLSPVARQAYENPIVKHG
ncbi:MAG TPA: hypothetical protein PKD45_14430 [Flavobacteriales bacterium]|nr:hypothetical protein [Flavobacteriales bacterium]